MKLLYFYRLGEACSHIAALLSCVIAAVESREKAGIDSVTSQSCKWLPPARKCMCIIHVARMAFIKLFRLPQLESVTSNSVILVQLLKQSHPYLSSQGSHFLKTNSNCS